MSIRKLIILAAIIAIPFSAHSAQKTIYVGSLSDKKSLNTNFGNAHDNFTEIYGNINQGVKTTDNPSFASVHASGGNLAAANKQVTKAWMSSASVAYTADVTSVIHGGHHWICKLSHTSNAAGAEPGVGGSWTTYWTYVGEVLQTVRTTAGGGSTTASPSEAAVGDELAGKQASDSDLTAFSALTCTENQIPKKNSSGVWACGADNEGTGGSDSAAIHDNVSGEIAAITEKTTPVSADLIIIEDSAAANAKKRVQIGNLPTGGSMTWPSTAGIPYWTSGTAWGGAYNATTKIPTDYVTNLSGTNTGDQTLPTDATIATTDVTTNNASTTKHGWSPKATAPAAGMINVEGIANGETARTDKPLFDATSPTTQAFGDSATVGSAMTAARRDHKHAMMAAPTTVSGNAGSATVLQTARTINGQPFNGSANITIPATGIPIVDAGGYLTGTELEAVLQEIAAKIPTGVDGNRGLKATENTIDYSAEEAGYFVYTSKSGVPHYYGGTTDYVLARGAVNFSGTMTDTKYCTYGTGGIITCNSTPAGGLASTDIDTSAEIRAIVGDESGTGALIFAGGDIGAATATTPSANDNDTSVATTAYVQTEIGAYAADSKTLTNTTMNTASTGNNITVPLNGVLDGAITDPADADDMIYKKVQNAMTLTDIHCLAEGGGTITLTLQECTTAGASCANIEGAITCDADGAEDDGTLTDGAIAAGAWIKVLYSAPTGTVTNLAWTVYGTQTW